MKVSICVPTYNNPEETERLLRSIECQSFSDYEVCISDDSTDDRVRAVVRKAGNPEGNILYRHNDTPLGHIYNWNAAMDMGRGEYTKIMFSDDWFTCEDSLRKMVEMLDAHPTADLAFSGSMQVPDAPGKTAYARRPDPEYCERLKKDYRYLFISNQIGAPSDVLLRSASAKGYRFDERSNWASDVFLYFRVLSVNPEFVSTDEPLISIGMHEEQYTHSFEEYDVRKLKDYELLYRMYHLKDSAECRNYFREYARENRTQRFRRKIKSLIK